VVVVPTAHAGIVHITSLYQQGYRCDPAGRPGQAHLMEHLLCDGSPATDFEPQRDVVAAAGGEEIGATREDYTTFAIEVPVDAVPLAWEMQRDRHRTDLNADAVLHHRQRIAVELATVVQDGDSALPWQQLPSSGLFQPRFAGPLTMADTGFPVIELRRQQRRYAWNRSVTVLAGDVSGLPAGAGDTETWTEVPVADVPSRDHATTLAAAVTAHRVIRLPGAIGVAWRIRRGTAGRVTRALAVAAEALGMGLRYVLGPTAVVQVHHGLLAPPWETIGDSVISLLLRAPVGSTSATLRGSLADPGLARHSREALARCVAGHVTAHAERLDDPAQLAKWVAIGSAAAGRPTLATVDPHLSAATLGRLPELGLAALLADAPRPGA
jgi:hypothetical protein